MLEDGAVLVVELVADPPLARAPLLDVDDAGDHQIRGAAQPQLAGPGHLRVDLRHVRAATPGPPKNTGKSLLNAGFSAVSVSRTGVAAGRPKAFQGIPGQAFPPRRPPARDPAAFTGLDPVPARVSRPTVLSGGGEALGPAAPPQPKRRKQMSEKLSGKRIAFLVANEGVEQIELVEPAKAVREAGGRGRPDRARRRTGPGLQPPRQGGHLRARQDRRRGRPGRLRRPRAAGRGRQPRPAARQAGRGRVRRGRSSRPASRSG